MPFDLESLHIDPDIRRARTLPSAVYRDRDVFELQRETVFARTWHLHPSPPAPSRPGEVVPWDLLPGCLDEPLLLTRGASALHCLSNVCTHRGKLLVNRRCEVGRALRCGYHGRRFGLDGRFESMPRFEDALGFPTPADDLPRVPHGTWQGMVFASLRPNYPIAETLEPLRRVDFLPFNRIELRTNASRSYEVQANWALYVDNYLEGLHIPFVHPALGAMLDFDAYRVECSGMGALQLGIAGPGELTFEIPPGHPDFGLDIAGYYFWIFPATMINVYPWGVSINIVLPLGAERTRVEYRTYVWDAALHERGGAGACLDRVEMQDEAVVEACARGMRSRLYTAGRYAPRHEQAVHHFHRLLVAAMKKSE